MIRLRKPGWLPELCQAPGQPARNTGLGILPFSLGFFWKELRKEGRTIMTREAVAGRENGYAFG